MIEERIRRAAICAGGLVALLVSGCREPAPDEGQSGGIETFKQALTQVGKWNVWTSGCFTPTSAWSNHYTQGSMTATFTGPGPSVTVSGFWDGGACWRVRFAPSALGVWNYTTSSSDSGLNGQTGSIECVASTKKGHIKINPSYPKSFMYSDGTSFLWIGDTSWDFDHKSMSYSGGVGNFKTWVDTRATQKFTVLQGVLAPCVPCGALGPAGPPRYLGENEGGMIFTNVSAETLNAAHFQNMDTRVEYIMSKDLVLALAFGWGNADFIPLGATKYQRFAKYIAARYGAYNVVWAVMGEYEEVPSYATDVPAVANAVKAIDGHQHIFTSHTTNTTADSFGSATWINFHGQQNWTPNIGTKNANIIADRAYGKPVVNLEYGYDDGFLSGWSGLSDDARKAHWTIMMGGGFATYGQDRIAWNKPATWPGDLNKTFPATQIQYMKTFFDGISWWDMDPANGLVTSGTGYVLRKVSGTYLAFLPSGGSLTLNMAEAGSTTFTGTWFNTRTGASQSATVPSGTSKTFTAPDANDWVLKLFAAGGPTLVGHWKLDEGSGTSTTADSSGNGLTGTLVSSPTWVLPGKVGNAALSFNGSTQYVNLNNPTQLQLTGAISLAAWAKVNSISAGRIVSKNGPSSNRGWELNIESDGSICFQIFDSGNVFKGVCTGAGAAVTGTWYHVVGVYEPGVAARLYINNGTPFVNSSVPTSMRNSSNNVRIGLRGDALAGTYLNGTVDDVRVYNGVLTASDVTTLYNLGSGGGASITNFVYLGTAGGVSQTNLQLGNVVYADRTYTFNGVAAALAGKPWVKPMNGDKAWSNTSNLMTFNVSSAATVNVCKDSRITSISWLTTANGWNSTANNLTFVDNGGLTVTLNCYAKSYASGAAVALQGQGSTTYSQYVVVVR